MGKSLDLLFSRMNILFLRKTTDFTCKLKIDKSLGGFYHEKLGDFLNAEKFLPSVTRLTHRSWTGIRASGRPRAAVRKMETTSPMLEEIRYLHNSRIKVRSLIKLKKSKNYENRENPRSQEKYILASPIWLLNFIAAPPPFTRC